MSVGRQRVTPVARIRASASLTRSAVRSRPLKSTPPKPLTWRSKNPGESISIAYTSISPRMEGASSAAESASR